jgi:hypothetical protein
LIEEHNLLKTLMVTIAIVMLVPICTYVTAQENTAAIDKSMGFEGFMAV